MANAVFISKKSSSYDDAPEDRYHFPGNYLNRVKETLGDWILYYESRRDGGHMVYFAAARVARIEPDPEMENHYYAYVSDYVDFTTLVPFRVGGQVLETSLLNSDGSINPGRGINAVRIISRTEFQSIFRLGLAEALEDALLRDGAGVVEEDPVEYGTERGTTLVSRVVRDVAFTRNVRIAYEGTCAFTGLNVVDAAGRHEVEAAHIKSVAYSGPDSVRNGIALSRTLHWMFDRGIFSIEDDGKILSAKKHVPDRIQELLNPSGYITFPANGTVTPHRSFLRYHRENVFVG